MKTSTTLALVIFLALLMVLFFSWLLSALLSSGDIFDIWTGLAVLFALVACANALFVEFFLGRNRK